MKTSFIVLGLLMGLSAATEVNIESSVLEEGQKEPVKKPATTGGKKDGKPADKTDTKGGE